MGKDNRDRSIGPVPGNLLDSGAESKVWYDATGRIIPVNPTESFAGTEMNVAEEAAFINDQKQETYGLPEDDFNCIARMWAALITKANINNPRIDAYVHVPTELVPIMMAAVKLSRLAGNPTHRDSAVDVAGYMVTLEKLWPSLPDNEVEF